MTVAGWDGEAWETYTMLLLRQRFGSRVVPVPDKSGGDGGLDAFVVDGSAWQSYAPENEPLTPAKRFELQRKKITADLGKLEKYVTRVGQLLGSTILTEWTLITPIHESSDLVAHCSKQAARVRSMNLPFVDATNFHVFVQDLSDFHVEHHALQRVGALPSDMVGGTVMPPEVDSDGNPLSRATGPSITIMDDKLATAIPNSNRRNHYRGELLGHKISHDGLLSDFTERVPSVAETLRNEVSLAKRAMLRKQGTATEARTHLEEVEADIVKRVLHVLPELGPSRAETLALGAMTQWLQECSMAFDDWEGP